MVSSVIPFMASSDAKSRLDICSFWVVGALTRASRKEEVRLMFEEMLGYSNLGGVLAEEIGHCGEASGLCFRFSLAGA
jgi:GH15 family glucan-1,4-alpha-glucosidase